MSLAHSSGKGSHARMSAAPRVRPTAPGPSSACPSGDASAAGGLWPPTSSPTDLRSLRRRRCHRRHRGCGGGVGVRQGGGPLRRPVRTSTPGTRGVRGTSGLNPPTPARAVGAGHDRDRRSCRGCRRWRKGGGRRRGRRRRGGGRRRRYGRHSFQGGGPGRWPPTSVKCAPRFRRPTGGLTDLGNRVEGRLREWTATRHLIRKRLAYPRRSPLGRPVGPDGPRPIGAPSVGPCEKRRGCVRRRRR